MQFAVSSPRQTPTPDSIERVERPCTVQTGIWIEEHGWLYRLFKSPDNTSPRFRFPDLLGACVSLTLGNTESHHRLVQYLVTQLILRDPRTERRSCDLWSVQFDLVMAAHRAPWNRFPHPMFELDQITTACVAVVMSLPEAEGLVLRQARLNLRDRVALSRALEC